MATAMATALLGFHIAAGIGALVLGPLVLVLAGRPGRPGWHDRRGRAGLPDPRARFLLAYQVAVLAVCASALGLVALAWSQLWWLTFFAVGTAAAVLGGEWIVRRHSHRWGGWYVRLTYGSYVAVVTALLVVSWPSLLSWVLPTLVGAPLVEVAAARAARGATARTQ